MFKKAKCQQTRKSKIMDYLFDIYIYIYNLTKLNQDEIKKFKQTYKPE